MNYHERTLYVMRKDGHYDVIYKPKDLKFRIDQYRSENKQFLDIAKSLKEEKQE